MTLKVFLDKCRADYLRFVVTETTDSLQTEHEITRGWHLWDLRKNTELLEAEIEAFMVSYTPLGLCWYIALKGEKK